MSRKPVAWEDLPIWAQVKKLQEDRTYLRTSLDGLLPILSLPDADPGRIVAAVRAQVTDILAYVRTGGPEE